MRTGSISMSGNMIQSSTGYSRIANGKTSERPGDAKGGMMRFNTDTNALEVFNGTRWYESLYNVNNFYADRQPTSTDDSNDGYALGSLWIYGSRVWFCSTATIGAASWLELSQAQPHPGVVPGRYYTSVVDYDSASTYFNANTLYAIPCQFPAGTTWNRIGIEAVSVAWNGTLRLGIYDNNNGAPGKLLKDAGTVTTSTTGTKEIVISYDTPSDWFWLAVNCSAGIVLRSIINAPATAFYGRTAPSDSAIRRLEAVKTYGAMPAVFPTCTASSNYPPMVWLRSV